MSLLGATVLAKSEVEFAGNVKFIFGSDGAGSGSRGCVVACFRIPISIKQAAIFFLRF